MAGQDESGYNRPDTTTLIDPGNVDLKFCTLVCMLFQSFNPPNEVLFHIFRAHTYFILCSVHFLLYLFSEKTQLCNDILSTCISETRS